MNCSTITLLGYLSNALVITKNWHLFNGDIAFDNAGNLYFLTVGFADVAGNGRYCDARLLRIAAANIPNTPGTGSIPLSLLADYNGLDSTVVNGISFNLLGQMFFSTRTFNGPQNSCPGCPTFNNVIFRSTAPGVGILPGFTNLLQENHERPCELTFRWAFYRCEITERMDESGTSWKWDVNMNNQVAYCEVQSSDDGNVLKLLPN